ncbi:PH domain-containing protein [Halorarum halophilum]|uniref:PH domain-containing protein n=1 Tax=Halorarum halophilum TaxID=2743090 RepID=A0A7D5KMY5_9EURY|nr:PH domain-containing protein [Halobaculum halophilum]QLG28002.1 PH domain-containing protein [Halobaculum halophilum]
MAESVEAPSWVHLAAGEDVVWAGRPSPYLVKRRLTVAAVVFLVGIGLVSGLPGEWTWVGWPVAFAGLGAGVVAYVRNQSVTCVITTAKLTKRTGIVGKSVKTVPLDRVQNVSLTQSSLQRVVDCGDVSVETAGADGDELVFESVPNPVAVNGMLVDQTASTRVDR